MFDPRAVGVDLTPAQQDETLCDSAFFLDNFGSTCAVRTKLQEQESDIKRLDKKVRRLLTCPRDNNLQQEEEREEENNTKNREGEEKEDVDETMADLDFFLRTFGSTRAVREKLETQSQRIVGLHRTVKWLQERWHPDGEGLEDSSDVEYLGTEPAPKADKIESKSQVKSDEDERADGTNNARSSEKEADVVPTGRRCCQLPNCEKYAQVNDFCATHGGFRNCKVHGCDRKAVLQYLCRGHGGGTRCKIDGCNKFSVSGGKGHCTRHARQYGVMPKLICKVHECNDFRAGKFYCHKHSSSCLQEKRKQKAPKQVQSFEEGKPSSANSIRRSRATCRAVRCMKWVKRDGDNPYCVKHRCPSASFHQVEVYPTGESPV